MYEKLTYSNSAELCEQIAAESNGTAILAFSTGKDSIAAWLQMRKYFKRIIPYYCYVIPDLDFVEDSLKYYEDFFGQHIYRLPHPSFFRFLENGIFQPKDMIDISRDFDIPMQVIYNDGTVPDVVRGSCGLTDEILCGVGVRMADSPVRRLSMKRYGAVNMTEAKFYPVYDWKKADILQALDESGVKLPVDYEMFGRTFDGIDYRFLKPLKERFPEDYKKILDWFPLAEVELKRRGE